VERVYEIREDLCELIKEYQVNDEEDNTESSTPTLAKSGMLSIISARVASRRAPTMIRLKYELDRYLEDELVPISVENF
jgi:leucyl aminopeptidase